jgi:hypothetical protein
MTAPMKSADEPAAGWTADADTFGARLALIRQRMGWGNVKTAAEQCGVPVETWRSWERDNRVPSRLTTIAMTIATRTGCDYLWLVHGPNRGNTLSRAYEAQRVVTRGGTNRMIGRGGHQPVHTRSVRQTRPVGGARLRPATPVAV